MTTRAELNVRAEGYEFSGIYERYKPEAKERAKKKREEGYKARVIFEPASKYSRGSRSGGWSVFIKPTGAKLKELEAEKVAKEEKRLEHLKMVKEYLMTRTGVELVELVLELNANDECCLLSWARKRKIIV